MKYGDSVCDQCFMKYPVTYNYIAPAISILACYMKYTVELVSISMKLYSATANQHNGLIATMKVMIRYLTIFANI